MSDSGADKGGFGVDLGGLFSSIFGGGDSGGGATGSTGLPDIGGGTPAPTVSPSISAPDASSSPFVTTSPFVTGNEFDYLGSGAGTGVGSTPAADTTGSGFITPDAGSSTPGSNVAPGPGFTTSDASLGLNTPALGSTPAGSAPSFSDWTAGINSTNAPTAAGGASTVSGGTVDTSSPLSANTNPSGLSTSGPGIGATSIAPAAASAGSTSPADQTSSWGDMLKKGLTSNPISALASVGGLAYNILNGQKQTANNAALTTAAQSAAANSQKQTDAGIAQVAHNTETADKLAAAGTDQTQKNITANTALNDKGAALQSYLSTGTLPPEYMSQVDTAISDAKTKAISAAASNGQPTDPSKNSSLAQQLAQIDQQKPGMVSQLAQTLFNSGTALTQIGTGANTSAASSELGSGVNTNNASAASLLSGGANAAGLSGTLYSTLTNLDTQQSAATSKAIAALASALNGGQPNTTQPKAA